MRKIIDALTGTIGLAILSLSGYILTLYVLLRDMAKRVIPPNFAIILIFTLIYFPVAYVIIDDLRKEEKT